MEKLFTLAEGGINPAVVGLICVLAVIVFTMLIVVFSRYKKCPPDKIMVI